MLVKLIHWLRGFLTVRISGPAPERFINLCCNRKIFIWDLKRIDDGYQFHIMANKFTSLKPIVRKTGIVPKISAKFGFPFIAHRYRKHKGFFIGVLLCLVLIYLMSLFIWDISILGGSKYTPEAMLKFLQEKQVYTGILKKEVDCQEIEETIRLTYKDIGWVSAEIKGTRLIIKITETNMPAPAQKAIAPSHMVATKSGIVKEIITRTGTPMVKVGDVVKKGDILVSGIITIKGDFDDIIRMQPVVADADITCKSYYDYKDKFPMVYQDRIFTGKVKKGYFFSFIGKKLFLYNPRNSYNMYDIINNEYTLHVTNSFYLPMRYGTILTREYNSVDKKYTKEEASAIAQAKIDRYFKRLMEQGVLIKDNNIKITIDKNNCIAKGRIIVEEPAWEYRTIIEDEWRIPQTDEHSGDNH